VEYDETLLSDRLNRTRYRQDAVGFRALSWTIANDEACFRISSLRKRYPMVEILKITVLISAAKKWDWESLPSELRRRNHGANERQLSELFSCFCRVDYVLCGSPIQY
jgi:hypothetical protein